MAETLGSGPDARRKQQGRFLHVDAEDAEDAADAVDAADAEPHVLRICSLEHSAHVWWIGSLALERRALVDRSADCEPCPSSWWD